MEDGKQRISRQKGKTNVKYSIRKERNGGKKWIDVGQDQNDTIKGVDKKRKLRAVREWRRRRLWFQRVMPRSECPSDMPDLHRRPCLPAGLSIDTVTVTHMEHQYRFDSEDGNGLTVTWRLKILPGPKEKNQMADHINGPSTEIHLLTSYLYSSLTFGESLRPYWVLLFVMSHRRKKAKINESYQKLNETFEPGRPLGVLGYVYGCWKVCQRERSLSTFRKLQSEYHESLPLKVREVLSPLESKELGVWRTVAFCEEASGVEDEKMAYCWKEKRPVLTHNMVRFGPRTLVGASKAKDEFLGMALVRRTAQKKKGNQAPLTHNLVRFGSRTLVGAKRAADISDQEEAADVMYQKKGFSAYQL
ncbi:uncharacterized protein LOC102471881 isoform X2 [Tupaia chinensis]|uniref:uncharacterized protein LOC102471881 isoform X2 n=1 Tax=Tupaia chinensis TaxID=246437 RepID=UPI0003C90846|nr:uncharacterized protein LOC102471881 isoform X2 [Tupaia chinensis]